MASAFFVEQELWLFCLSSAARSSACTPCRVCGEEYASQKARAVYFESKLLLVLLYSTFDDNVIGMTQENGSLESFIILISVTTNSCISERGSILRGFPGVRFDLFILLTYTQFFAQVSD